MLPEMASEPPSSGLIPRLPITSREDAERLADFVRAHAPARDRNALTKILTSVFNHGIPETLAQVFDGDTHGGPYRSCTEPKAALPRAQQQTNAIDREILEHPALKHATAALIDISQSVFPGTRAAVLKAALDTPLGLCPVETTRAGAADDIPLLIHAHFARLDRAGPHRGSPRAPRAAFLGRDFGS